MKCERCKNENNQIKAGSQKYKCKHYGVVFKILVHAFNIPRFIWIYALGTPINYAEKYGVTKGANRYDVTRQYIYRWKKRYDGTLYSLMDKSHRPHSHPNQHTEQELKLITDMRRRNPNAGLVVFWVKLRQRGYTRSITSLYRILLKTNLKPKKLPNPKYVPKPYEKMLFPG